MSTIVFSRVFFSYGARHVLSNVSFTCGPSERLVVVGPNGIGKSTLLGLASGTLQPDSGTVTAPFPFPPELSPPDHHAGATQSSQGSPPPSVSPLAAERQAPTVAQFIDATMRGTRRLAARFESLTERLT